ncbi:hypothetical protein [Streptomyces rochei]|uniref:hypothetical protein n=1 Tax=Streptomyces rochei TaxID=1928 RepID=UPI0036BEC768
MVFVSTRSSNRVRMPPRRKKTQKNDLDRLGKLAATLGINIDNLLEEVPLTEIGQEAQIRHEIEAESVIFYIESKGSGFKDALCKYCGGLFLHTFIGVSYCSDNCRAQKLSEYGIIWNFHKRPMSQRWNAKGKGYVPKIIGVEATAALVEAGYVEIDEEKYVPEVPYNPNFKLSDLKEHADTEVDEQEVIELEEKLKEAKKND